MDTPRHSVSESILFCTVPWAPSSWYSSRWSSQDVGEIKQRTKDSRITFSLVTSSLVTFKLCVCWECGVVAMVGWGVWCVGGGGNGGGYGVCGGVWCMQYGVGGGAHIHMYYDEFVPFIFSVSGRQTFHYSFSINTKQLESLLSRGYSEKTVDWDRLPRHFSSRVCLHAYLCEGWDVIWKCALFAGIYVKSTGQPQTLLGCHPLWWYFLMG